MATGEAGKWGDWEGQFQKHYDVKTQRRSDPSLGEGTDNTMDIELGGRMGGLRAEVGSKL